MFFPWSLVKVHITFAIHYHLLLLLDVSTRKETQSLRATVKIVQPFCLLYNNYNLSLHCPWKETCTRSGLLTVSQHCRELCLQCPGSDNYHMGFMTICKDQEHQFIALSFNILLLMLLSQTEWQQHLKF